MSSVNYVDYNSACFTFDHGRTATGVDEMVGMIYGMVQKPFDKIRLLDAGCGTGNYSKAFVERGIGHVTLLDASEGMLKVASEKLNNEVQQGKADVKQHNLPELPYPEKTFDVVTLIHVIHQLDMQPEEGETSHPNLIKCIQEAFRVLDKNGMLLIVMSSQDQVAHGAWFRSLIPKAARKFQRKYLPVHEMIKLLKHSGFNCVSVVYRPDTTSNMTEEVYNDIEGPLRADWRGTNSMWNVVDGEELKLALEKLTQLKNDGKLRSFFEEHDQYRQKYGMDTVLFARK